MKIVLPLVVFIALCCSCPALGSQCVTLTSDSYTYLFGQEAVVKANIDTDGVVIDSLSFGICSTFLELLSVDFENSIFPVADNVFKNRYYCAAPSDGFCGKGQFATFTFKCQGTGSAMVVFDNLFGTNKNNDKIVFSTEPITIDVTPVPEPSSVLMLGSGLAGLIGFMRRKAYKTT